MTCKDFITIGIDASNIRQGGGVTHLSELLQHSNPSLSGISKVIVWSSQNTLGQLPNKPWLQKESNKLLDGSFFSRTFWQIFNLTGLLNKFNCKLLLVPGGSFKTKFRPVVSMNQNLLPFEWKEILRYKFSLMTLKLIILRFIQTVSFQKSDGIIFLSKYSQKVVLKTLNGNYGENIIIPHGVGQKFFKKPRKQFSIDHYSSDKPFKIIYVSSIDFYKHQWNVVKAVSNIKQKGYPVCLDLYGASANKRALKLLKKTITKLDSENNFINFHKEINYNEIEEIYFVADLSIFSSSCETFGQILLESMAAGLPITCSNLSAVPEIIKKGAVYFNPLDTDEIEKSLMDVIDSKGLRTNLSNLAYKNAGTYSWTETSLKTFNFLKKVAQQSSINGG